jgi:formamidopyrimidine-DNA glycosylase
MSIELPEAKILAGQMQKELLGKRIVSYELADYERLQKIGMLNKDESSFSRLVDREIKSIESRGNSIIVKFDSAMNLLLSPEYGGKIFYHTSEEAVSGKFHLKLVFEDGTVLTTRLTSMGVIFAVNDKELERSYTYMRDFNPQVPSPLDEDFTFDRFSRLLSENNRMLKAVLVGKDAVLVGLSNSAFQDVIYRAGLHPKRKAGELSEDERQALYDAIRTMVEERLRLEGKDQFYDLYGKLGGYAPAMGPNMKEKSCPVCGASIDRLSHGGGQVYICPNCQV